MSAKRFAARLTGVLVGLVLVVGVSVGTYYDAGGWPAVALVWGVVAACSCLALLLVWVLENWNAP